MKQLNKIILSLVIFMACLFVNSNYTAAEEVLNCSNILKNGSTGTQVKILQKELNTVMACGLTADGAFGTKTKTCVINFQKLNSLTQDGIVGSKTCTKLNTAYYNKQTVELENAPSDEKTLNVRSKLSQGAKNDQVKLLQTELNKVMACGLTVDGAFGAKSRTCVIAFQKKYGLTADGIVGIATAGKLNTLYLASNNYVIANVSSNTTTDAGKLKVYAKATENSEQVGVAYYGTIFKVHGTTTTNGVTWYKVNFNGKYSYINSKQTKKDGIVVDISDQTFKMYKNGKLTMDTAVITGNDSILKYRTTLIRSDLIVSKKELTTYLDVTNVDGTTGSSYVDYWMPFYGAIGFHDANYHYSTTKKSTVGWRSNSEFYNVNTYKTNGSHGCVNMLYDDAKALYNSLTEDITVYVVA